MSEAVPVARTSRVSKKDSATSSKPLRRRRSAREAVRSATVRPIRVSPSGPW